MKRESIHWLLCLECERSVSNMLTILKTKNLSVAVATPDMTCVVL